MMNNLILEVCRLELLTNTTSYNCTAAWHIGYIDDQAFLIEDHLPLNIYEILVRDIRAGVFYGDRIINSTFYLPNGLEGTMDSTRYTDGVNKIVFSALPYSEYDIVSLEYGRMHINGHDGVRSETSVMKHMYELAKLKSLTLT